MHRDLMIPRASRELRDSKPAVKSTNILILERGKISFRQALFKPVKSTHMHYLPMLFFTITIFGNHSGYITSLLNLTASNFFMDRGEGWVNL
jgi:hypothetical protein